MNNTNVHSKFTLISLFSKIHSLKSEHIHSFLFREYIGIFQLLIFAIDIFALHAMYIADLSDFHVTISPGGGGGGGVLAV